MSQNIQIEHLLGKAITLAPDKLAALTAHYSEVLEKFLKCEINVLYVHILEDQILIQEDVQLPCKTLVILTNNASVFNPDRVSISQFPGDDLVNALYQNVHYTVNPLFSKTTHGIQSKTVPVTKKKLAEVELALVQLQNNVEIPTVNLQIHQEVVDFLKQVGDKSVTPDDIPKSIIENGHFLNELQTLVNDWLKNIKILISLQRDPRSGSASQEISFWLDLEKTLEFVEVQLKSPGVSCTLLILQQARRFHGSASFIQDTGLKDTLRQAKSYNFLFHEFPISELLSAEELNGMTNGIKMIFEHMTKKAKIAPYPVSKLLHFLEALSKDVNDQALRIINGKKLMGLPKIKFDSIINDFLLMFKCWDDHFKEFGTICRELLRKRAEAFVPYKILNGHEKLQQRVQFLAQLRDSHDTLQSALKDIMRQQESDDLTSMHELDNAYDLFTVLDVLDTSNDGHESIQTAEATYNSRVSRIEAQFIEMLRNLLKNADTPQMMLAVFEKYHLLLGRSNIRGGLLEFQSMTLEYLKSQIKSLQDQYVNGYENCKLSVIHHTKGIPMVSGRIMWIKHLETQMLRAIDQLKALLGNVQSHYEGQKIIEEYKVFTRKIDINQYLNHWVLELKSYGLNKCFDKSLFLISNNEIKVNFSKHLLNVYRECRNLQFLNIQVPLNIQQFSKEIKKLYPIVVSLFNSFYSATHILSVLESDIVLIDEYCTVFYQLLQSSHSIAWSNMLELTNTSRYHSDLVNQCDLIKLKANRVLHYKNELSNATNKLTVISNDDMQLLGSSVQSLFDSMQLDGLSNISYYYEQWLLNSLFPRLNTIINTTFTNLIDKMKNMQHLSTSNSLTRLSSLSLKDHAITAIQQELHGLGFQCVLRIENQRILTEPPLLECKEWLLEHVNRTLNTFAINIHPNRFNQTSHVKTTVSDFALYMDNKMICKFYELIHEYYNQANGFLDSMRKYQGLLKCTVDAIQMLLKDSLTNWLKIMSEMKKDKSQLESQNGLTMFGPILIDYSVVKEVLISKYTAILNESQMIFMSKVHSKSKSFLELIKLYKLGMEEPVELNNIYTKLNITLYSSSDGSISLLIFIHYLNKQFHVLQEELQLLQQSHLFINRCHLPYANDWIYYDNIESNYNSVKEYLKRKTDSMQNSLSLLKQSVVVQSTALQSSIIEQCKEWDANKPIQQQSVESSLEIMNKYNDIFNTLLNEQNALNIARDMMELQLIRSDELSSVLNEIKDLQTVWDKVSINHNELHELGKTEWQALDPKQIRVSLEQLNNNMDHLPPFYKQYTPIVHFKNKVTSLIKSNSILFDLQSPALKPRHFQELQIKSNITNASAIKTVQDIWDLQLNSNMSWYKELISTANGEYNLEQFIEKCKQTLKSFKMNTFHYKQKIWLLRQVDDLFETCEEYSSSLNSMKSSPYYKSFEEDALYWSDKVNSIYKVFNTMLDVQKLYMHLEGVFTSSKEIKNTLPNESQLFESHHSEFIQLTKKSNQKEYVLDIINIPNIQSNLDRIYKGLCKLQKSLSNFLEQQRTKFPRFYFIGDDDLLQLIGDTTSLQFHLTKLFPGIARLLLTDNTISGIYSKENEHVELVNSIKLNDLIPTLQQLELEIKNTLLDRFASLNKIVQNIWDNPDIISSILHYPFQIIELSLRYSWTVKCESLMPNTNNLVPSITGLINQLLQLVQSTDDVLIIKKLKNLIKELLPLRKSTIDCNGCNKSDYKWLQYLRTYVKDKKPEIAIGHNSFEYKCEYYGVVDKLIRTDLTNDANLTFGLALNHNLGCSPSGKAGTGKTESVKQMANVIGVMCFVFCCDEAFDVHVMKRILYGLSAIGSWGCFDEFNRLESDDMSLVSVLIKQLRQQSNNQLGIFITMNPTYKGRNALPLDLVKLFRPVKMEVPDLVDIAEALLYCDGFTTSSDLAILLTRLFNKCELYLDKCPHYDFGLRAMKSVLLNAGIYKHSTGNELDCVLNALASTIAPKLTLSDSILFESFVQNVFNRALVNTMINKSIEPLLKHLQLSTSSSFVAKVDQFLKIHDIYQGFMCVGYIGKSTCISVCKQILQMDKKLNVYNINAKVLDKHCLYGQLNTVSKEWTDGVFTSILRKCISNASSLSWIIFDCDIDPIWCENLNSVLDDNKTLTLPNGERLVLHENIKLIFEVNSLQHATPATVSRNGIIYFDKDLIPIEDVVVHYIHKLSSPTMINLLLSKVSLVISVYEASLKLQHIMDYELHFYLNRFIHFVQGCSALYISDVNYNTDESDSASVTPNNVIMHALFYASCGDVNEENRSLFIEDFKELNNMDDVDYYNTMLNSSGIVNINSTLSDNVVGNDFNMIIPTVDTVRNESLITELIHSKSGLILVGPAGSGKTMSLVGSLKKQINTAFAMLNFSSETSCDTIITLLKQQCDVINSPNGLIMTPKHGKSLIVFCDEINLVKCDDYGTQIALSLIWQLITQKSYHDVQLNSTVNIQNIIIIGACNPPTYKGRIPISHRLLRHMPVLNVGYPSEQSLIRIYNSYMSFILKHSSNSNYGLKITKYLVNCYMQCKIEFPSSKQSHYIYSPRELSRWVRGIHYFVDQDLEPSLQELVELIYYEGERLFHDRLIGEEERLNCKLILKSNLDVIATPTITTEVVFSNWMSRCYQSTNIDELRLFLVNRLKTFNEEESINQLYLTNDFINHLSRIDRVLKQPNGHLLLFGTPGSGRKSLCHFACWLNGISVEILSVYNGYSLIEFDELLRKIIRKCVLLDDKIALLIDDSSIIESSFIERMNTLLANSEIPGLFDNDEYNQIIQQNKKTSNSDDVDGDAWFVNQIRNNLHVVFTMQYGNVQSPALFNRCVVNYMGDWSVDDLMQVAMQIVPVGLSINETETSRVFVDFHRTQSSNAETSPMTFLHAVKLFELQTTTKLNEIQEQQHHFNNGLDKINSSVSYIAQLKNELTIKNTDLQSKQQVANSTLKEMVVKQQEAELKKQESITISNELQSKQHDIQQRQSIVQEQLSKAEPAVELAKQSVSEIKKQHLTELRSMQNPPVLIKTTMECICYMLGNKPDTWKVVQQMIRKDDFISNVVNYDTDSITPGIRNKLQEYLSDDNFNAENVNRASKACGPLFVWMTAQLSFSSILLQIGPLKKELNDLQVQYDIANNKYNELIALVDELTSNISVYQSQYTAMVSEVEQIKNELNLTSNKVNKAELLLNGLDSEQSRWTSTVSEFKSQLQCIIGDCILQAIFIAYLSIKSPKDRSTNLEILVGILNNRNIPISNTPMSNLLITPKDKLLLQPDDVVYMNHGIIKHSLYPLFIVGKDASVIVGLNKYQTTSFNHPQYIKVLENCIRFGTTCIINDANPIDPIIMPLLNKQYTKQGGRLLIQLGKHLIEQSPSFQLILTSTTSALDNAYACRCSVVNYTTSKASLQSNTINRILHVHSPHLHQQLQLGIKQQLQYTQELQVLEHSLLQVLHVQGNLLDNPNVLSQLQTIKQQSSEIQVKLDKDLEIQSTINKQCESYHLFSEYACTLYFKTTSILNESEYTINTDMYMETLNRALESNNSDSIEKLAVTFSNLFYSFYCTRLEKSDELLFTLLLLQQYLHYYYPDINIDCLTSLDAMEVDDDKLLGELMTNRNKTPQDYHSYLIKYSQSFNLDLKCDKYQMLQSHLMELTKVNNATGAGKATIPSVVLISKGEVMLDEYCKDSNALNVVKSSNICNKPCVYICNPTEQLLNSGVQVYYIEPSSSIYKCYESINSQLTLHDKEIEYSVLFKITWLHIQSIQRLLYIPIGMHMNYDINQSDLHALMMFIRGHNVDKYMFVKLLKLVYMPKITNYFDCQVIEIYIELLANDILGIQHDTVISNDMDQFYRDLKENPLLLELDVGIVENIAKMGISRMINKFNRISSNTNENGLVIGEWIKQLSSKMEVESELQSIKENNKQLNALINRMKMDIKGIEDYYKGKPSIKIDDVLVELQNNMVPDKWITTVGTLHDLKIFINQKGIMQSMIQLTDLFNEIRGEDGQVGIVENGIQIENIDLYGCLYNGELNMDKGSKIVGGFIGKIVDLKGYIDLPIYRNEQRREYMEKIYIKCSNKELIRLRSCALYLQ
eukprot:NODE_3_length_56144_cov_0.348184.p1 type:complete len:4079 gc:universal NODE_3_length_56144_cov_0.348184:21030-33266(+)